MSLKENLIKDLQDAMRSGDELRKTTIRMARTAIRNAEMAHSAEILDMVTLNDPAAQGEVYDEIKRLRKLASEYEETEQLELADKERKEIGELVSRYSELDDAGVEDVLRKEIKQRRDSAREYSRANRTDLADKELAEIAVLEKYLPQQMSEDEIETEVRAVIAELGASGPQDMSKVMPAVMARLRGRADGRVVNQVVTGLLSKS